MLPRNPLVRPRNLNLRTPKNHRRFGTSIWNLAIFFCVLPLAPVHAGEQGSWVDLPSMTTPRQETGAALLGRKVYVVGGLLDRIPFVATNEVEAFDLDLNLWVPTPAMPQPRDHAAVASLAGKLYVIGGFNADFNARADMFIYDPGTNQWSTGTSLPSARGACWAVAQLGKIYVFGGDGPTGNTTRTTFIYDSDTLQWSQGADMATAREHLNAVGVGPFIYVIGGRNGGGATGANERYNPALNSWRTMAPMPTARSALFMETLGTKIYAAGGEIPQLFATHEIYDVATNTWTCAPSMAIPRHGIAAVSLDEVILAPGGGVIQGLDATNRMDSFVPTDYVLTTRAEPVIPQVGQPFSLKADLKNPFATVDATLKFFYLVDGSPIRCVSLPSQRIPAGLCLTDQTLASLGRFPSIPKGLLITLLTEDSSGNVLSLDTLELSPIPGR